MLRSNTSAEAGPSVAADASGFPVERRQGMRMRRIIERSLINIAVLLLLLAIWTFYPIALAYYPDGCIVPGVSRTEQAAIEAQVGEANLLAGFDYQETGDDEKSAMERVTRALNELLDRQPSFSAQLAVLHETMRNTGAVFYGVATLPRPNTDDVLYIIDYALPLGMYGPILPLAFNRWGNLGLVAELKEDRLRVTVAGFRLFSYKDMKLFRAPYEGPCIEPESFSGFA